MRRINLRVIIRNQTINNSNDELRGKYSKSKSDNEIKEAERIDQLLQPLHKSLFIESNPAPVKYAAKLLGLCDDEIRLPLVKIKKETQELSLIHI